MSLISKPPQPEDVFTPRSASVNPAMYVPRQDLEDALVSALRGRLHIVVHGESGTGKSWLYKKVLADERAAYSIANLANASRLGSIAAEIKNNFDREGRAIKTGYEEEKAAGLNGGIATGSLSHTGQYEYGKMEPFEACLRALREKAGKNPAVLVFDNLEAAFTEPLLKELADMLILCDDERYAQYNVRILIVGVTGGIKEYYYKTPHHSTVANRIYELTEVSRLTSPEAALLIKKGLIDQLAYQIDEYESISRHIAWVTDRVPQMLHEYGLELSYIAEKNGRRIKTDMLENADRAWMYKSLNHSYAIIESHMNERDTKTGRRNQTLFALSLVDGEHFKALEIEGRLRKVFPNSTQDKLLNVPQMTAQFAKGDRPIIKRSPKGDAYSFVDPKYRMVLRAMLVRTADERVIKRPLYR
jgi:hypothetical protein